MVCGINFFDSRTYLVAIFATVTAQIYDDNILQLVMFLFLLRHPGLALEHENARPHTARVAMSCL